MNRLCRFLLCLFAGPLLFALSGCSDLVPGLNISEGKSGTHQYQIVRAEDSTGYAVEQTATLPSYTVVPIDSRLLGQIAQDRQGKKQELPSLLPSDVPPEYKLGPGDIFFVVVWDHPELTTPYAGLTQDLASQGRLIAADGTSYYPYVGTFQAGGMTAAQLREYIAEHLKPVIQNPQVDVRVVSYRAQRIEVTGEVLKPSTLNFNDTPMGILQAIDACGGLTPAASRRRALLVRHSVVHQIDLAALLSGDQAVSNPALEPGDVLHLPDQSGDQVFVLGAVARQVPVVIQQDSMTLIQALTQAGGLDVLRGKDSGILVFRVQNEQSLGVATKDQSSDVAAKDRSSDVSAYVYTLDLSQPQGVLLASQFQLEPRDVVYVKATAFSQYNSVIAQMLPTVTGIYQAVIAGCIASGRGSC